MWVPEYAIHPGGDLFVPPLHVALHLKGHSQKLAAVGIMSSPVTANREMPITVCRRRFAVCPKKNFKNSGIIDINPIAHHGVAPHIAWSARMPNNLTGRLQRSIQK